MRTFEQKPKAPQQTSSARLLKSSRAFSRQSGEVSSTLHLKRAIGNQTIQRLLQDEPVHASADRSIQQKLSVNAPGDLYEQEADQVANRVVQQRGSGDDDNENADIRSKRPQHLQAQIVSGSNSGKPLDTGINEEMSRKIGFDFSIVRVHTDNTAIFLNKWLNARAFTHGSDIYFNKAEYSPNSSGGKNLLAHELTHVVQQSRMTGNAAQRGMIQRTTIGEILDNFFSPLSRERLWIMPERDNYTRIARTWQPVIDAVNRAKAALAADCAGWRARHMTDSAWRPGRTDPPVTDPNANRDWIASPPGTDPATCRNAFIIYASTKAMGPLPLPILPGGGVQTFELYTCSIGSFGIYATADSIDCAAKTARMNIWMYNAMDRDSFGQYARHPLFALSRMARQYMWWNWHELHRWGPVSPAPASAPREGPEMKGNGWVYG